MHQLTVSGQHRWSNRTRHHKSDYLEANGFCKVYKPRVKRNRSRSGPDAIPSSYTCKKCHTVFDDKHSDNRRKRFYAHRAWKCQPAPKKVVKDLSPLQVVACDQPRCKHVETGDGLSVTTRVRKLLDHIDITHFGLGVSAVSNSETGKGESDGEGDSGGEVKPLAQSVSGGSESESESESETELDFGSDSGSDLDPDSEPIAQPEHGRVALNPATRHHRDDDDDRPARTPARRAARPMSYNVAAYYDGLGLDL